jgi:hypothetical protein
MSGAKPAGGISQFCFKFKEDACEITITRDGTKELLTAATDGSADVILLTEYKWCSAPPGPMITL